MISSKSPDSWQGLQIEVARILKECGFTVEIEKMLETVRGDVEVDVYAEEIIKGRKNIIICECKHWKNKVPKNVIHGFRTILGDIGANTGYIVSTQGFQSGAFKASELTNVNLVTWNEFQNTFEETWFEQYLVNEVVDRLDPLLTYSEPLLPRWYSKMTEDDKNKYNSLKEKYDEFGWLIMLFTPYVRMLRELPIPMLPIREQLTKKSVLEVKIPDNIATATGYREFLDLATEYGVNAIVEYRTLRDKYAL